MRDRTITGRYVFWGGNFELNHRELDYSYSYRPFSLEELTVIAAYDNTDTTCQHVARNSPCFQHTPCPAQLLLLSLVLSYTLDLSSIAYALAQVSWKTDVISDRREMGKFTARNHRNCGLEWGVTLSWSAATQEDEVSSLAVHFSFFIFFKNFFFHFHFSIFFRFFMVSSIFIGNMYVFFHAQWKLPLFLWKRWCPLFLCIFLWKSTIADVIEPLVAENRGNRLYVRRNVNNNKPYNSSKISCLWEKMMQILEDFGRTPPSERSFSCFICFIFHFHIFFSFFHFFIFSFSPLTRAPLGFS